MGASVVREMGGPSRSGLGSESGLVETGVGASVREMGGCGIGGIES